MTMFNSLFNQPVQLNTIEQATVQFREALNRVEQPSWPLYRKKKLVDRQGPSRQTINQDQSRPTISPDDANFLKRVGIYGLLGVISGQRGGALAMIALGIPTIERLAGQTLEEALAVVLASETHMTAIATALNDTIKTTTLAKPSELPPKPLEPDAQWREVIIHPSVVLILGKRGIGKTALGYRLLELNRYALAPYVVGVPDSARNLLPDWIGVTSTLEGVPPKSIALVDEAYLSYHARGSLAAESRSMSQIVNLSRQRDQTIIFVSQEARQVDRNIASSANVIVFKSLGMLQLKFDRPELNKLAAQAQQAFITVKGNKHRWSFVYSPDADFLGLLENNLPTFWKPRLSHLFAADSSPSKPRGAKRMTPQERAQKAREMRAQGASYGEICQTVGVKSRSTIQNYVKGYPYQR